MSSSAATPTGSVHKSQTVSVVGMFKLVIQLQAPHHHSRSNSPGIRPPQKDTHSIVNRWESAFHLVETESGKKLIIPTIGMQKGLTGTKDLVAGHQHTLSPSSLQFSMSDYRERRGPLSSSLARQENVTGRRLDRKPPRPAEHTAVGSAGQQHRDKNLQEKSCKAGGGGVDTDRLEDDGVR